MFRRDITSSSSRVRKVSFGRESSNSIFLLFLMALCAFLFGFGIVLEFIPGSESEKEENSGEILKKSPESAELLVSPDEKWNEKEKTLNKGYRILWKKTEEKKEESESLWGDACKPDNFDSKEEKKPVVRKNWDEDF